MSKPRVHTKDIGLTMGLSLNRFLFDSEDLHYGYWPDDLPVRPMNLPKAQELYADHLVSHIPAGTKTILDVGCGSGKLAKRLLAAGYEVDCVSPSEFLSAAVRENIKGAGRLYECKFEDLPLEKTYDLVLCSESFQYVKLDQGAPKLGPLVKPGGHVLHCDYYRNAVEGKSFLGGGHRLALYEAAMATTPFERIVDVDITKQTGRTIDLMSRFFREVGVPVRGEVVRYVSSNWPRLGRIVAWFLRRRLGKLDRMMSGEIDGAYFARFKTYRLFVYRKRAA